MFATPIKSLIIFFCSLFVCFVCYFTVGVGFAFAGSADNVSGWAWSENIGWISFNGDNVAGGADYGVHICLSDTDPHPRCAGKPQGAVVGFAWSENIGWISFERSDTGTPPAPPFNGSENYIAKFDFSTKKVTGWARALAGKDAGAGGWDGWIKLGPGASGWTNNDVRIDMSVPALPYEFYGWASGSADYNTGVVGWISFNGDNVAGGADYHVQLNTALNQSPTANNLTLGSCDYCIDFVGDVAYQSFSWLYSDPDNDNESQYQFQIANDSGFSSLQVDKTISGLDNPSGSTNSQTIQIVSSPLSGQLTFNRQYWWRVKVWDSDNNDSGWKEGGVFTTSRHPWPLVNFSWMPSDPTMNEDVQLLDQSTVYGGATKSSWAWAVSDATYIGGTNNTTQNPMVRFSSEGDKLITLTVTDSDGFSCTATRSVSVNIALPSWKEISPK